jgi:multicomponent Na+:H+ antiporter subunit E
MKSRIILFVLGFIVWLVLTWPPNAQTGFVGLLVAALVSALTGDMFVTRPYIFKQVKRYLYFFLYVPMFVWECFKANVDVAYRVAHPRMPIRPGIVKVKTGLRSETGLTFLANSITLTPGTLSVDIDREHGYLYVHWINVLDKDVEGATEIVVRRFERILGRIFE